MTHNETTGAVQHGLRFFVPDAPGGDDVKTFLLEGPGFDTAYDSGGAAKKWEDVRKTNNVSSLQLVSDYRGLANTTLTIGEPIHYEVTMQLVPGWRTNADWDVNPGSQVAIQNALDYAGTEAFRDKYNTDGAHFKESDNRLVGRVWAINTTGIFGTAAYFRPWGPFQAAAYGVAFDFGGGVTKRVHTFDQFTNSDKDGFAANPLGELDRTRAQVELNFRPRPFVMGQTGHTETSRLQPLAVETIAYTPAVPSNAVAMVRARWVASESFECEATVETHGHGPLAWGFDGPLNGVARPAVADSHAEATRAARLPICGACEHFNGNVCERQFDCGVCYGRWLEWVGAAASECPEGLWPADSGGLKAGLDGVGQSDVSRVSG